MQMPRNSVLIACLAMQAGTIQGAAAGPRPASLEALGRQMMSVGLPNRMPGPIAGPLGLEPDAPVHHAEISRIQATDRLDHSVKVLVELSTTTPRRPIRPIDVVFETKEVLGRQAIWRYYRASLDGSLQRAILLDGEVDDAGISITGSGKLTDEDVGSSAVQKRFQHELDLWLKRRYLKKEWRSAEFSAGILKKGKSP